MNLRAVVSVCKVGGVCFVLLKRLSCILFIQVYFLLLLFATSEECQHRYCVGGPVRRKYQKEKSFPSGKVTGIVSSGELESSLQMGLSVQL